MVPLFKKMMAECFGTFFIVLLGCGSIAVGTAFPGSMSSQWVPIIFGLGVMVMIYAVGHVSGAHFNPAVTLAFAVARHFSWRHVPAYAAAHVLGALLAVFCLMMFVPNATQFGAPVSHVSYMATFFWEAILSFLLMFVITAVATDTRAVGVMAGTAIGATVAVAAFVGGPMTGAAINPARALAPLLVEGRFDFIVIYMTAPFLGTVLGALFYEKIRCHETVTDLASDLQNKQSQKPAKGCC